MPPWRLVVAASLMLLLCVPCPVVAQTACQTQVASNIEQKFPQNCGGGYLLGLLQGQGLTTPQWALWCNACGVLVNSSTVNLYAGCASEEATIGSAFAACKWGGEVQIVQTNGGCTPEPVTTPEPSTASPPDASGSGSSVGTIEFTGPITTVFTVCIVVVVCMVSSIIWFCYIRKTPEEKKQDAELRNFNLLDVNPRRHRSHSHSRADKGQLPLRGHGAHAMTPSVGAANTPSEEMRPYHAPQVEFLGA